MVDGLRPWAAGAVALPSAGGTAVTAYTGHPLAAVALGTITMVTTLGAVSLATKPARDRAKAALLRAQTECDIMRGLFLRRPGDAPIGDLRVDRFIALASRGDVTEPVVPPDQRQPQETASIPTS